MPGLTRDRHYGRGRVGGKDYLVVDTGGFEPVATDGILHQMARQARQAVDEAMPYSSWWTRARAPYTIVATARVRAILYASDGQRAIDLGRPTRDQLLARRRPTRRQGLLLQPAGLASGLRDRRPGPVAAADRCQARLEPGYHDHAAERPCVRVSVLAASVGSDRPSAISVRIFPRSLGAPADGTLKLLNDKLTYSGNVTLSELTGAALVRLWVPSDPAQSTQREAVTDLTLYGTPEDSTAEVAAIARNAKPLRRR